MLLFSFYLKIREKTFYIAFNRLCGCRLVLNSFQSKFGNGRSWYFCDNLWNREQLPVPLLL